MASGGTIQFRGSHSFYAIADWQLEKLHPVDLTQGQLVFTFRAPGMAEGYYYAGTNGSISYNGKSASISGGTLTLPITLPSNGILNNVQLVPNLNILVRYGTLTQSYPLTAADTINLNITSDTYIDFEGYYIDEPIKISVNPGDVGGISTITYTFGTLSGTIASNSSTIPITWTPTNLLSGLTAQQTEAPLNLHIVVSYPGGLTETIDKQYTLYANPETQNLQITAASIVDTNPATIALTGLNSTIVAEKSAMRVRPTITTSGLATVAKCEISTQYETLIGTDVTFEQPDKLIRIFVTDTRGFTTERTFTPTKYINYFEPKGLVDISMTGTGTLTAHMKGIFFNATFGSVTNTITCDYRYRAPDSAWSEWANLNITIEGESIGGTVIISGLEYRDKNELEIRLVDKLTTTTIEVSSAGIPVFDWSKNDFNFNVPVHFSQGATGLDTPIFECNTAANVALKMLSGDDKAIIREGAKIYVLFANANTVENINFRIGVSTYPAKVLGGSIAGKWDANSILEFLYYQNAFLLVQ